MSFHSRAQPCCTRERLVFNLGSFVWSVLWSVQAFSILCPGGPDNARDFHMEMIRLFS
jgi:hypothetical protein